MKPRQYPAAWSWWVDELIPGWVKARYSKHESWKSKPFSEQDAKFYFRGIEELSELFTDERPSEIPPYFQHERFRSAYLLYFLPLQAAKFITLFQLHRDAYEAALKHGLKTGTLRLFDLGAGPASASLAFLLMLLEEKELPERIELELWDTNPAILQDGKALAEDLAAYFPKLRGKVSVRTHIGDWWQLAREWPGDSPASLIVLGNVLNENPRAILDTKQIPFRSFTALLSRMSGAGMLVMEPAARRSAQLLSRIRDTLFEEKLITPEGTSLWGPCLHAGKCPLAEGRDWCHFSFPSEIPGKWFKAFSKKLSSERQWVKFCYLWFSASDARPHRVSRDARLVISDPLRKPGDRQGGSSVLLCEPERPGRLPVRPDDHIHRGDIVELKKK